MRMNVTARFFSLVTLTCFFLAGVLYLPAQAEFQIKNDNIVLDQSTNLEWQQRNTGGHLNFEEALDHCENLTQGNHSDWRLPDINELLSIMDFDKQQPLIDTNFFSVGTDFHMSSTPMPDQELNVWGVTLYFGNTQGLLKTAGFEVLCVRAGPYN